MSVLVILSSSNNESPNSTPRRIFEELPGLTIEVVHFEQSGELAIPYLWVRDVETAAIEATFEGDPAIVSADRLDANEDGTFYKVLWEVDSPFIHCVVMNGGKVMEATGNRDEWTLTLWFESDTQVSNFQQCCHRDDIPIEIHRLTSVAGMLSSEGEVVLSEQQREALILAMESGYFDEPRNATQSDIGDELGISSSAVGRLLRRGTRNLVLAHLS